jgi:hypothetical protein
MNAMGHGVPTLIGVRQDDLAKRITRLVPDYMAMGEKGMHEMAEMEMPLPDNTLPMMTGQGPFGAVGMGGMFSVLKVRRDLPAGSTKDPGWFRHPPGTVAREWTGDLPAAPAAPASGASPAPAADPHAGHGAAARPPASPPAAAPLTVRKPGGGHHGHH